MFATVLESFMLICFGFSWPLSLLKNIRSRSAKNMSLPFILLIVSGYVAGISAKLLNGQCNYVLAFYFLNLFIVGLNIPVYLLNKCYDDGKELVFFKRIHQIAYYDTLYIFDIMAKIHHNMQAAFVRAPKKTAPQKTEAHVLRYVSGF